MKGYWLIWRNVLPLSLLGLCLVGCSGFNRAWKQAAQQPSSTDSLAGRWSGRWLSAANGHTGELRCLISRQTNDTYSARFHATYAKLLKFGYTVPLSVTESNHAWQFQGSANLGIMAGGVYRYEGTATPTHFHSTYTSKYDHGTFEMERVGGVPDSKALEAAH